MNLPNRLTMIRFILAVPFIIFLQYSDSSKYGLIFRIISLVIFVIASLTDFVDGYIARKYNLITDFGKIMDPLADKILVISALVIFVQLEYIPGWMSIVVLYFPKLPAAIISPFAAASILIPLIKNSRAKTIIDIQPGIYSNCTNITSAEITSILSARGSIIFPKSVIKLYFLAI